MQITQTVLLSNMELKRKMCIETKNTYFFSVVCLICVILRTYALAYDNDQGDDSRQNRRSGIRSEEKRSVDGYTTLPGTVTLQTLKNASIMMCTDAMAQPYARMVQLNDEHMRAILQDKGGNYVKDYMAATQEEALENFPNMLILTKPFSVNGSITSFSMMDNLVTKQTIIDDLNKLTAFLTGNNSTTHKNETQLVDTDNSLGSEYNTKVTSTKSSVTSEQIQLKSKTSVVTSKPANALISTISPNKITDTPNTLSTISNVTKTNMNVESTTQPIVMGTSTHITGIETSTTQILSSVNNVSGFKQATSDATSTANSGTETTTTPSPRTLTTEAPRVNPVTMETKTTTVDPDVLNSLEQLNHYVQGSGVLNNISNLGTRELDSVWQNANTGSRRMKRRSDDTNTTTTPSPRTLTTKAPRVNPVTMETKKTAVDPDILKGIEQLQHYVQGAGFLDKISNLGTRELDFVWRHANTTLHPTTLLGLVTGSRRMKRRADGSYSQVEYCQNKGSLTDDHKFVHLCSICATTTKLPGDMFPRYINEAVCKTGDTDCFTVGGTSHGQCKQTKFSLNMLRKTAGHCNMIIHEGKTLVFESWELVPQLINVSCECTINKLSMFSKYAGHNVPLG